MIFNKHLHLEGQHAFLSASKYHWVNYDDARIEEAYLNYAAAQRGTELHDFARRCIELGIKLPKSKKTLNLYVNDAIGYKMTPEQVLYYSMNCFGTADAISFRNDFLRVHDFKSGTTPAKMGQLEVYASIFCLEYSIKPSSIGMELRIYQSDEVLYREPTSERILEIMEKIVAFDKRIDKMKLEV